MVRRVLVDPAVGIAEEIYLGCVLDRSLRRMIVMASGEGGVDIEATARERPEAVYRREIPGNEPELPQEVEDEVGRFLAAGLRDADAAARRIIELEKASAEATARADAMSADLAAALRENSAHVVEAANFRSQVRGRTLCDVFDPA